MASPSPLLMIVSQGSTKPQPGSSNQEYSSPKSEHPKLPRGRKPTKSNKSPMKKKPSQRGMGVERLERLRLQEKWGGGGSSLPEAAAALPAHLHQFQPPPHPLIPVAAPSPAAHFGPQLLNMADPKVRLLGGGSCGSWMARGWVGGLLETSRKELSSIPKLMPCHHHQCDACCSKNKCHHALTGLHSNHGHTVGLEMKDFNGITMRQIYHHINKQEAEMMGVTRLASGLKDLSSFLAYALQIATQTASLGPLSSTLITLALSLRHITPFQATNTPLLQPAMP
uniref:Uncharacterized protein n=1 Tax=Kalanchoe fedtschenkoi TaxID=63787 RepID=A0A7N0SXP9_KALFE